MRAMDALETCLRRSSSISRSLPSSFDFPKDCLSRKPKIIHKFDFFRFPYHVGAADSFSHLCKEPPFPSPRCGRPIRRGAYLALSGHCGSLVLTSPSRRWRRIVSDRRSRRPRRGRPFSRIMCRTWWPWISLSCRRSPTRSCSSYRSWLIIVDRSSILTSPTIPPPSGPRNRWWTPFRGMRPHATCHVRKSAAIRL